MRKTTRAKIEKHNKEIAYNARRLYTIACWEPYMAKNERLKIDKLFDQLTAIITEISKL